MFWESHSENVGFCTPFQFMLSQLTYILILTADWYTSSWQVGQSSIVGVFAGEFYVKLLFICDNLYKLSNRIKFHLKSFLNQVNDKKKNSIWKHISYKYNILWKLRQSGEHVPNQCCFCIFILHFFQMTSSSVWN